MRVTVVLFSYIFSFGCVCWLARLRLISIKANVQAMRSEFIVNGGNTMRSTQLLISNYYDYSVNWL